MLPSSDKHQLVTRTLELWSSDMVGTGSHEDFLRKKENKLVLKIKTVIN